MKTVFTRAMRRPAAPGVALVAVAGMLMASATPVSAQPWRGGYDRGYRGDGAGVAVAAGLLGLAAGAAIASSGPGYAPYGYPAPVAYGPYAPSCFEAYPGYSGYCYPASYYYNMGWMWHGGYWWHGGNHYARPFAVGGWRGGYGGGHGYGGFGGGRGFAGGHGGFGGGHGGGSGGGGHR